MGIRVHKMVGYGLADLQFSRQEHSNRMTDPRIDWNKLYRTYNKMCEITPQKFMNWMKKNWDQLLELEAIERCVSFKEVQDFPLLSMELLKDHFKRHKHWNLSECFNHCNEFGMPNVMLFIPPSSVKGHCSWYRYDDTMDWIEETFIYESQNRVVPLNSTGIYPYDGAMVRFRDPPEGAWPQGDRGKMIYGHGAKWLDDNGLPRLLLGGDYNRLVGRWDPKIKPMANGELLKHLLDDWRPSIPSELLAVLLWMKSCFRDFDEIKNALRPLLYVYWG